MTTITQIISWKFFFVSLGIIFLSVSIRAAELPDGFVEMLIAENLDPVSMVQGPNGDIYIAEKNGRVLIIHEDEVLSSLFFEIEVDNYNERGLSGIAFDPHFEHNGYFYAFYTVPGANKNRVSRFKATDTFVDVSSEKILIESDVLSGTIHNAGALRFGLDEKLYISMGDGANADNAWRFDRLLGKILRINTDGTIPDDNPYYDKTEGKYKAIYALGFRNSFTMDIDPLTGRFYANDVGNSNFEEVNEIVAGGNYGWPFIEGNIQGGQTPPDQYQDPVHAYSHSIGCSVIGAAFYQPETPNFPSEYVGKYFFGDYCEGFIKVVDPETRTVVETFATNIDRPVAILTDKSGAMYYLERAGMGGGSEADNTSSTNGRLWKIFYSPGGKPFISVQPSSQLVAKSENVTFKVKAQGTSLSYQWYENDTLIENQTSDSLFLESVLFADSGKVYTCKVWNTLDTLVSKSAILNVVNGSRPQPMIISPDASMLYVAGGEIQFSGEAIDEDEGNLSADQLIWRIDFHHDFHTHPAMAVTSGIFSGSYTIPTTGETSPNVWFKIYLTARDQTGLSNTVTKDIYPKKSKMMLQTGDDTLTLWVDNIPVKTPIEITHVVGLHRTIEAPELQITENNAFQFNKWNIDSLTSNEIEWTVKDQDVTFNALYDILSIGDGDGLKAEYYSAPNLDFTGTLVKSTTDATINFDWGGSGPHGLTDHFTIRWSGFIEPILSGVHTFYTLSDDGVRLWIDDQLIIDRWIDQGPTEWSGTINLMEGELYPVKLEYYEKGGGAVMKWYWESEFMDKSIVPKSQLYTKEKQDINSVGIIDTYIYPNPSNGRFIISDNQIGKNYHLFYSDGKLYKSGYLEKTLSITHKGCMILKTEDGLSQWICVE